MDDSVWGVASPGTKRKGSLVVPARLGDSVSELPVLLARGRQSGPRIVVLGGVHGDEYEGITGASAAWRDIDPAALSGSLLIVPVANPPAYQAGTRTSPADGMNLARSFPGRPDGALTERIAHILASVIRQSDFLIDLHSAGQHYAMPLLCGGYAGDDALGRRCEAAALAFGAPVYWAHPTVAPGRSLSVAIDAGIPCVYAECGGGGRVRPEDLMAYRRGVRRILVHVGALPDAAGDGPPVPPLRLQSAGDTDRALSVTKDGIFMGRASLLERIQAGQPLGDVLDPFGQVLETVTADTDGLVVMVRRTARVRAGDGVYLLAAENTTM
jgi:predicted deacylase